MYAIRSYYAFMSRFANLNLAGKGELSEIDSVIRIQLDECLEAYVNSLGSFLESQLLPDKTLLIHKFEELLLNIFTRPLHREVAAYLHSRNNFV